MKKGAGPSQTSPEASSDHDRLIQRLLSDRRKAEAIQWLKEEIEERTVGEFKTSQESICFVQRFTIWAR